MNVVLAPGGPAVGEEFGIWGGLDHDERRNLKRRMRRKQARALAQGTA